MSQKKRDKIVINTNVLRALIKEKHKNVKNMVADPEFKWSANSISAAMTSGEMSAELFIDICNHLNVNSRKFAVSKPSWFSLIEHYINTQ